MEPPHPLLSCWLFKPNELRVVGRRWAPCQGKGQAWTFLGPLTLSIKHDLGQASVQHSASPSGEE